jgi:CubicO group peptidase (beta-lactamase class C family)
MTASAFVTARFAIVASLACAACVPAHAAPAVPESAVDALFASWTDATPGCAVGLSRAGQVLLERAYGMADLERGVANRPDTIFEAGSVSKQFTAAAVLLLAEDGKLSLDDPVRKYVPELPDAAAAITVRQMLHHTSGLRDWGNVAGIGGWPRGTRVHTHDHVLDILARQEALNFAPGTRWSYSNSGYNLAAILVTRVAGEPFADFTRKCIFEPLGMTRTSWRDDYTRVVDGRAVAYARAGDRYALDMPFENVHGNGGLLTTVGDLLRWNENFTTRKVGGPGFVATMQASGRLASGDETGYGFGLGEVRYRGLQEFRHSGATGSYRSFLARFPDPNLSIAVLCNAGDSTPRQSVHAVADLYLGESLQPEPPPDPVTLTGRQLDAIAGLYRNIDRGDVTWIRRDGDGLRLDDGTPLIALSPLRLTDGEGAVVEFEGAGRGLLDHGNGPPIVLERIPAATPATAELELLAGRYVSEEAETTFTARVQDGALELAQRPATVYRLKPLYADAFESELGTILFRRDAHGAISGFSVVQDRIWDLRFRREYGAVSLDVGMRPQ